MSTFGEISEPSSRTVWEDWDENNLEDNTQLTWQTDIEAPKEIKTLLILEGRYLTESINKSECKLQPINSVPEINLFLYKTHAVNNYICFIKDYDLVLSSEIVELLHKYITVSDDVIAILTKPLVEYQSSENASQGCIVRKLSTANCLKSAVINYLKLEQPNIISGVSAGAVCLRDNLGLSASAVVFYIEHPEDHQIVELQKFLMKFDIVPHKSNSNHVLNSNLYI